MIDMKINMTSIEGEAKTGALVLLATMLFGITTLYFDAIKTPAEPDVQTDAPVVIKYIAVPEPQAIRPSLLMDWPLTARMIEVEEEKKPAAVDRQPEPEEETEKPEKEKPGRHRHHRRHRRHY